MRCTHAVRRIVLAASAVLAPLAAAAPASAAPGVLSSVRVEAEPNGSTLVSATFTGALPPFHLVGAGTTEAALIFDTTSLSPQLAPTIAGSGPVLNVTLAQTGASSSLALHLTAADQVRTRAAGTTLFISVVPPVQQPVVVQPSSAPVVNAGGSITQLIDLKYADVSEVAGILVPGSNVASNDTFSPTQTNIGTSSLSGTFGGGFGTGISQAPSAPQGFGNFATSGLAQRLNDNIAIDRRLNAIILTGTQDVVDNLREQIERIDVPLPSVILETQIVELSDSASRNVGLETSPDGSGVVANASTTPYTIKNLQPGGGAVTFAGNLYAQITAGYGKILAKPRILAQSGQPASILTGEAIPIFTSVTALSGTAVTSQQVNYINVGVNLQIQPRVSSDGFVTSHIYSEVSSVTSYTNGVPQISQRTASTIATVRDGEAFVIGGLLQDNEIRTISRLPFASDIPLIGVFFRHVTTQHTQTNLYIVVTPHIVGTVGVPPPSAQERFVPNSVQQLAPPPPPPVPASSIGR